MRASIIAQEEHFYSLQQPNMYANLWNNVLCGQLSLTLNKTLREMGVSKWLLFGPIKWLQNTWQDS